MIESVASLEKNFRTSKDYNRKPQRNHNNKVVKVYHSPLKKDLKVEAFTGNDDKVEEFIDEAVRDEEFTVIVSEAVEKSTSVPFNKADTDDDDNKLDEILSLTDNKVENSTSIPHRKVSNQSNSNTQLQIITPILNFQMRNASEEDIDKLYSKLLLPNNDNNFYYSNIPPKTLLLEIMQSDKVRFQINYEEFSLLRNIDEKNKNLKSYWMGE